MNTSVKYGLIGGLIYIILQMCIYLVDPAIMFSMSSVILFLAILVVIFVVCCVYAIRAKRNGLGGFITFKQAFTEGFITAVVISIMLNVFTYFLYTFIDPTLEEQLREFTMNAVAGFLESLPDEEFEEAMSEMEDQEIVGPVATLKGIAQFILYGAIIAAIASGIMKKEDPEAALKAREKEDSIDLL